MKHEQKECPCCRAGFECKPSDIINCQCYRIKLTVKEEGFIRSKYDDCLCRNCLLELKHPLCFFKEENNITKNR